MRALAALLLLAAAVPAAGQSLPAYLKPMAGSSVGDPYRVIVNGESSWFVNCSVEKPLQPVVEHYRKVLSAQSPLADLPEEEQKEQGLENGLTVQRAAGWVMLGVRDREGRTAGVVAFAAPDASAKATAYYLTVSEHGTPPAALDPEGDAPGRDPADVPRAEGLRRVFSIERHDPEVSTTHVFDGTADPAAVARHYREAMPAAGWRPDPSTLEEFPAGNLQAFTREARSCEIMIRQDGASGRTEVTVVIQSRRD